jgi:hypothetical protein
LKYKSRTANSTNPQGGVSYSKDSFVVNQSLVLHINPPRRMVKIATFAKPETVKRHALEETTHLKQPN